MFISLRARIKDALVRGTLNTLFLSCIVGILAAFGAIVFAMLVDLSKELFYHRAVGEFGNPLTFHDSLATISHRKWVWLLPPLGGLVGGFLTWKWSPESQGHGTDSVIEAYHLKRGVIRPLTPLIKTLSAAITIGTGGSAGKEGPIAQVAAGLGSTLGTMLKLKPKQIRILLIVGMAGGIGAVFHAPLAAAIFSSEVLYKEMEFDRDVFMPSFIGSIIAYAVFSSVYGTTPLLSPPMFHFEPVHLIPYTVVAVVTVYGARLFISMMEFTEHRFAASSLPLWLRPALGGLGVGVIGLFVPQALSEGYVFLQAALDGQLSLNILLVVAGVKMVTTTLTMGSGGSGGVFGPSIIIGGLLGACVGVLCAPLMHVDPGAFAIVGMAGFFAAAANVPISTIIMVSEISGSYSLLVPTMWVATLSYILGRGVSLYQKQRQNHFDAPAEMSEMMSEILARITVGSACRRRGKIVAAREQDTVAGFDDLLLAGEEQLPVVDREGRFIGVIERAAMRFAKRSEQAHHPLLAADLLERTPYLSPDDSLLDALRAMMTSNLEQLFVVDKGTPISYLTHQDIMLAYDCRMQGVTPDKAGPEPVSPTHDELFRLGSVAYDQSFQTKEALFDAIAHTIAHDTGTPFERVRDTLLAREALGSTAIGRGIAFPHPKDRTLAKGHSDVYLIRLAEPVDLGAPDHKPVHTVFAFWCGDPKTHVEALAHFSRLCVKEGLLDQLADRPDLEQVAALTAAPVHAR